jgi:hypothetical protein
MSEVTAFLATQPAIAQAALYIGSLVLLLCVGGIALTLVVRALDRLGQVMTSSADWQTPGDTSKEEVLLLISVLIYAKLLLSIEPPLRAFASVVGNALFASLILAPIAGAVLYGMSEARRASGTPSR